MTTANIELTESELRILILFMYGMSTPEETALRKKLVNLLDSIGDAG